MGQPLNLNLVELEFQGARLSSAAAEKVGILTLNHPNFCLRVLTPAWAGNAVLPGNAILLNGGLVFEFAPASANREIGVPRKSQNVTWVL